MVSLSRVLITLIWSLFFCTALADERQAILETVDKFFLAIETKDRELLESILVPDSLNISSFEKPDGESELTLELRQYDFYADTARKGSERARMG